MRRVILESPYAGDVERNVRYARAALRDSLQRGEAPIASHLLYTQPGVLDDSVQVERELGMMAGWEWRRMAHACVFYTDLGISTGMKAALDFYIREGREVEFRQLGGAWWTSATTPST